MDNEIKGEGNSLNYTFRMHDPRVGRFFATDPLEKKYPHNSPFAFSENRVMDAIELEGLEAYMLHGTGDHPASTYFGPKLTNSLETAFGRVLTPAWSGSPFNSNFMSSFLGNGRVSEAHRMAKNIVIPDIERNIVNGKYIGKGILIGGHSHGGNEARIVTKDVYNHLQGLVDSGKLDKMPAMNLLMVNTPVIDGADSRDFYSFSKKMQKHINIIQVDSNLDSVKGLGNMISAGTDNYIWGGVAAPFAPTKEFYKDADYKIEYEDQFTDWDLGSVGNHLGHKDENAKVWYPAVEKVLKKE